MTGPPIPDVQPGQVWADNDRRCAGRTLFVLSIVEDKRGHPCDPPRQVAICRVLTNDDDTQDSLDRGDRTVRDRRGKSVRIRLDRFRTTTTGYRYVGGEDVARALGYQWLA